MSFADPQSVTINSVAKSLPRVFQPLAGGPSTYMNADETFKLEISHQVVKGKRERHLVKLTQKAITANPFVPAENIENIATAYFVLDNPKQGFVDTDLQFLCSGLFAWLATTANRDKFIGGEA